MPRKWTILVIFIALLLTGFAAKDLIVSTFFPWYLKGYCRACLDSKLTYEKIRQEDGKWIFDYPVLTSGKRLEEGGFQVQADKASLKTSISWLNPSLSFSVNVDNPRIDIGKQAQELKKIIKNPSQVFAFVNVQTKFKVPHGSLFFHDFSEEDLVPAPLFFKMNFLCNESHEGCATLWTKEGKNEKQAVFVHFSQNDRNEPEINFDIRDVDVVSLQHTLRGIWPEFKIFEIENGKLNGKMKWIRGNVISEGQLRLDDAILKHTVTGIEVIIPEIAAEFEPQEAGHSGLNLSPSTILLKKAGQPYWSLEEFEGNVAFALNDHLNLSLNGLVKSPEQKRKLSINAFGKFDHDEQTSFSLEIQLKREKGDSDETSLHLSSRKLSGHWGFGEIECLGIGAEELELFKHLTMIHFPEWEQLHIHQGTVDAAMLIYTKGVQVSEINVERIAAHDLFFSLNAWDVNASVESAQGSLSFNLDKENATELLNANLKIIKGKLNLIGTDNSFWQLSNIDTNVTMRDGVFQKSIIKGTIGGLQGEVTLDGTTGGALAHLNLKGAVNEFSKALPESIRKGLEKNLSEDGLQIVADASKTDKGFNLEGIVEMTNADGVSAEIFFGFEMDHQKKISQIAVPSAKDAAYYAQVGSEFFLPFTQTLAMPVYSAYRLFSKDFYIPGFEIKNGWFRAKKLTLEKFISPFLFRNNQMLLNGMANISGRFDSHKIFVEYNVNNMVLENRDFSIEIKDLSSDGQSEYGAVCEFDLDNKTYFNTFPIRNAIYFEKNSGLLFTEINARLDIENDVSNFRELTTFCNGIYFAGSAVIDWSMPGEGVFEVDLRAQEMHGKISQLQHLLTHLDKSLLFLKIPIEGNVSLRDQGGYLHFSFFKEGYDLKSIIQGSLADGSVKEENVDLSLQELGLNFDYDHQQKTLNLSDIHASLFVGKPGEDVEEYTLAGNGVQFTDFSEDESKFDLWINEGSRDIFRIAGTTHSEIEENGSQKIHFAFDHSLTHFSSIYPDQLQIAFKDWSQLDKFQLSFHFKLNEVFQDLQKLGRTGLLFLSKGVLNEVNDAKTADGEFHAYLNYDHVRSALNFQVGGEKVLMGQKQFNKLLLVGSKKENLWSIDQLQLDNASLAFDLLKEGSLWNINFLGAKIGDYFLIGLEGRYSEEDSQLKTKINLLEADLSYLNEWPLLNDFIKSYQIGGKIRAAGVLQCGFDAGMPLGLRANLQLNGSVSQAAIQGMHFKDIPNLSLNYDSTHGLTLSNVKIGAKINQSTIGGGLFLEKANYNLQSKTLLVDGLHFDIPNKNLPWAVQELQKFFPEKISEGVAETIRISKQQGALKGDLNVYFAKDYSSLRIHLNDGLYQIIGREHDLKGFVIDWDPYSLKLFAEYKCNKHCLRIDAHCSAPQYDEGELVLSDMNSASQSTVPLKIQWKIHPQFGFYVQKMLGSLAGMNFDLVQDAKKDVSQSSLNLIGKIDLNFRKASSIFDDEFSAGFASLDLGEGYSFMGQFSFLKDKSKKLSDSIFFQGEFNGRNFEFYGYRFYNLSSRLSYTPAAAYIRGLTISDTCGDVQIEGIDFLNKGNGIWHVFVPAVNLNKFRPSLLNPIKATPQRIAKSLIIRNLNLVDLKGILGDRNSFTGIGQLTFANPPKKHLQHSILAIPAELLTRIGLDLAVLSPVRGNIYFNIAQGRAMIDRFKDVYSKGKLSKFYLANNGLQSYVDFDGNLNLQIRMKQYNLIFKLAELFTFNVQGTLRKPTYTLQKQ